MDEGLLGELFALKLDLTHAEWLAKYLLKRYPCQAEENPSLPSDLVTLVLLTAQKENTDPWTIAYHHALDEEQYRLVGELLAQRHNAVSLLRRQCPPSTEIVEHLLHKDESVALAEFVLSHVLRSPYVSLSTPMKKEVRRRVRDAKITRWQEDNYLARPNVFETIDAYRKNWTTNQAFAHWFNQKTVTGACYTLHSATSAHPAVTRKFTDLLGEEKDVWDNFLALSDSWTGTLEELAVVAKNLT